MGIRLSNRQARRLILHLQGLTADPRSGESHDEVYQTIHQLGFVQVDSIQWVERAHHMIMGARHEKYRPKMMSELIEDHCLLFENYTHDASIIPCEFFRYWKCAFDRRREGLSKRMVKWYGDGFLKHCDKLIDLVEKEGPIRSRDLERPKSKTKKSMWQWDDGKAALEFMWRTGVFSIRARDGFQKVYDLSSRVIPEDDFNAKCDHDAFVDWACRSAVEKLGIGSPTDIARFWELVSIAEAKQWVKDQGSDLVEVHVEEMVDAEHRTLVGRSDLPELVEQVDRVPNRLRAVSPFDPVIRDRNRLLWMFGFDYRIEIYVPEAKRKYGYYVFPLLDGDKVIGRIDMKANRAGDRIEVKQVWLEESERWSKARQTRLERELKRQAGLSGVGEVHLPKSAMRGIRRSCSA